MLVLSEKKMTLPKQRQFPNNSRFFHECVHDMSRNSIDRDSNDDFRRMSYLGQECQACKLLEVEAISISVGGSASSMAIQNLEEKGKL